MNITKCIITTNKSNIYSEVNDIGFGNIKKARLLTDEIFLNNKEFIQKYDYDGYKITWAWYDKVYQFSLKCIEIDILKEKDYDTLELIDIGLEYEKVIKKYFYNKEIISSKKKTIITSKIKEFITNSILLIFSMFSIIYFMLKRKNYTAIWTGDFIYKNSTSDFRLNYLYEKLLKNKISYIEFIRTRSLKFFLINTVKRKRFAIYFTKVKPNNFYESILFSYKKDNEVFIKVVKILKLNNVSFNFSSRKAHLILAAKSLKIKNIGIMHGLSRKEYVVNEFMESYSEDKYIGPDVFGVWSNEYVDYYREHCS